MIIKSVYTRYQHLTSTYTHEHACYITSSINQELVVCDKLDGRGTRRILGHVIEDSKPSIEDRQKKIKQANATLWIRGL